MIFGVTENEKQTCRFRQERIESVGAVISAVSSGTKSLFFVQNRPEQYGAAASVKIIPDNNLSILSPQTKTIFDLDYTIHYSGPG